MKELCKNQKEYCLNCPSKPCKNNGCPLKNNIPDFIHADNPEKAFEILCRTTVLPAICGKVCPHSKQCQGSCVRGINGKPVLIGEAESEIGNISIEENYKIQEGSLDELSQIININKNEAKEKIKRIKVAIIGSGPCGLTCASFLAKYGIKVTIYEKYDKLGGLLRHGIPEFRLNRNIVEKTIEKIIEQGIIVKNNVELGKDIHLNQLIEKFDAVFISIGANISNKTIKTDNTINSNEFLEELNVIQEKYCRKIDEIDEINNDEKDFIELVKKIKNSKVAVQGGGNVAMDMARTLKRLGADVTIVYRRDINQMPAESYEINDAKSEGINFCVKTNIQDFDPINRKLKCIKTELVKVENDNRLSPRDIEGSDFELDIDYLAFAIGATIDEKVVKEEGIKQNKWGSIQVNEEFETSIKNVFAGGDAIGTTATVAFAAMNGREAAYSIMKRFL